MVRFVAYFVIIAGLAAAAAWFAERPGTLSVSWMGYQIETTFLFGLIVVLLVVVVLLAAWAFVRGLIDAPGALADFFRLRRQKRGYQALSKGMIAVGSGDADAAARHAAEAGRLISSEPMAQLLKAQTAQMKGDKRGAIRVFEAMLQSPETEILGLRGLFIQAQRDDQPDLARGYAERAAGINPGLDWASEAMLAFQSANGEWEEAERTLASSRRHKLIGRAEAQSKRAMLLTARALDIEDEDERAARDLALEAHALKPDLVPAAVVAGRILAGESEIKKAARILEKTWKLSPHPDIAEVYGDLRHGDSPRERLKRVRTLAKKGGATPEANFAITRAAIEAREWDEAREAIRPVLEERPSVRACMLMAEIEEGENGDRGRAREWLGRALKAPRDPVWTADGHTSEDWQPVSPVTGELGAFTWRVPLEAIASHNAAEDAREPAGDDALLLEAHGEAAGEEADTQADDVPEKRPAATHGPGDGKSASGQKNVRPTQPETEKSGTTEIFVAPRAPDDPGPDRAETGPRGWLAALFAR